MTMTYKMLHEAATRFGGWNYTQAGLLGVPWPLKQGWLKGLIGTEISEETWRRVMAMRGLKPKERKRVLRLEKQEELI